MTTKKSSQKVRIGCIGQGWVGKNIADNFESRGFFVSRYSKEAPHNTEKAAQAIADCDIVFIAVPTPTKADGFDDSIVRSVIKLVGKGKIAVIKSTVLPGTTDSIQKASPEKFIFHVPEFLTEANAAFDVANPSRNIIGIPKVSPQRKLVYEKKAKEIAGVIPFAPSLFICSATEAELVKYVSNCFLATKVIFANTIFDITQKLEVDYSLVAAAVGEDHRIGKSHLAIQPEKGRGAGGHCFIKDLAALREYAENILGKEDRGTLFLKGAEEKNIELLATTGKDKDLLLGVYGPQKIAQYKRNK